MHVNRADLARFAGDSVGVSRRQEPGIGNNGSIELRDQLPVSHQLEVRCLASKNELPTFDIVLLGATVELRVFENVCVGDAMAIDVYATNRSGIVQSCCTDLNCHDPGIIARGYMR